jgi:catechol 2,3-dioxygenase-like lactoylglutathione lyase family enzyme
MTSMTGATMSCRSRIGQQIGAVNLIVGDLERSKAFYRDVFGLPLQHEDEDTAMSQRRSPSCALAA